MTSTSFIYSEFYKLFLTGEFCFFLFKTLHLSKQKENTSGPKPIFVDKKISTVSLHPNTFNSGPIKKNS